MKIDFIVIGASRSGTTWLHDNLINHPEIFMPKKVNEPTFFTKYYNKGFDYYFQLFEGLKNQKAVGEITPDYLFSKKAAIRIHNKYPKIKLIVILRNPQERLYSMYWMMHGKKINNYHNYNFNQAFTNDKETLEQGKYIKYINNYLKLFEKNQLLFLTFDELKSNPKSLLKKIYYFIKVNDSYEAPYITKKINRASFHGSNGKSRILFFMWKIFQKFNFKKIAFKIEKMNSNRIPDMSNKDKSELIKLYKPYNQLLQKLVDYDISNWNF